MLKNKDKNSLDCSIVIPTYYPGQIINELFKSLPNVKEVFVLDNGNDIELKNLIKKSYVNIEYRNVGDIGLGKTFNKSLEIITSNNLFITQPDVIIYQNCIENLLRAKAIYTNAIILSPLYFDDYGYHKYDFFDLPINKKKKLISKKKKKIIISEPWGDFSIEGVASTSNLIDVNKIKTINGWDNYFYTYLEDLDVCLRARQSGYEIIKIQSAKVYHKAFSSHKNENKQTMNNKRIFNFTKSSLYFNLKHASIYFFIKYLGNFFLKTLTKIVFNSIIFNRKKIIINYYRLKGIFSFLFYQLK